MSDLSGCPTLGIFKFYYVWNLHRDGTYEIAEAEGVQRGTKIVLYLKDDCAEFSSDEKIKRKYSS